MKERLNKLHQRLINSIINNQNINDILISTYYNNALFPILNYLIKDIKPTENEIENTLFIIEYYEEQNNQISK